MILEVRLIGLFNECLATNQPQSVLKSYYISILVIRYSSTVKKSITVETSVPYVLNTKIRPLES